MRYQHFFFVLIILFSACTHLPLQTQRDGHVEARLISQYPFIEANTPFWLGVVLKMDPQWHIYWKNPGDSGTPTRIKWTLPEEFSASDIHWPSPVKIDLKPLRSYGYEGETVLLTQIIPGESLNKTTIIKAHVEWLMCKVECIPGQAQLNIQLPTKKAQNNTLNAENPLILKAVKQLPHKESHWKIAATYTADAFIIHLKSASAVQDKISDAYFFPERDDIIEHASVQTLKKEVDGYSLEIPRSRIIQQAPTQLKGLLYTENEWEENSQRYDEINVPLTEKTIPISKPLTKTFLLALIFAFIGGLILNLMPCVLPVLSIKILSLLKDKENKKQLYLHGLSYTAGVVFSFTALAIILIILRSTGAQLGWGFQFQSPVFLILLSLLFLVLALNLFGLFEITLPFKGKPLKHSGLLKSFFNGILITITATPCTAPFMGTALGFALTQPTAISLLVFIFLGLGTAFPYLLLCLFPSLLNFLPKPGPWMITLKRFLGVLLLASVCWLGWILLGQLNTPSTNQTTQKTINEGIKWQPYSQELIDQLLKENKNIFIDFTARWCLTCQVNKRLALENPAVINKFKELDIAAVKADWTSKDNTITQALESYGKNSIPLYVFYSSKQHKQPVLLPELITPQIVLETLEKNNK